jgi:hypothetical protein
VSSRRLAVAIALSIAVHEIVAGAIPASPGAPPQRERIADIRISSIQRLATPTPSPPPLERFAAITHRVQRVTLRAGTRSAAIAQTRAVAVARPVRLTLHRATFALPHAGKPSWDVAAASSEKGSAGTANAGAGTQGTGAGTQGSGTHGSGTATADANEPCGFVTFSDPHGSQFDSGTHGFYVDIRMSVHFADGSAQSLILDYPWYYASEAQNPWSDRNLKDPAFPTRFQPPPAAKAAGEPELVRYVMQHSTAEGMTLLHDCPTSPVTAAPRPDRSSPS